MTATATRKTRQATIERRITIGEPCGNLTIAHIVEITNGAKIDFTMYFLSRKPSDFGVYIKVEKVEDGLKNEAEYDVMLDTQHGHHTCDCKWGTYGGHKKACRHIEMALQARNEYKL